MKEVNGKDYALSLLNKEKMKLVKSISFWKNEVIRQEKWIENFKVEVEKLPAEKQNNQWIKYSLEKGIENLNEYKDILKEEKHQLMSINHAISVLKNNKKNQSYAEEKKEE